MKIPKKIKAFGYDWKVIIKKDEWGGSFKFNTRIITIGGKSTRKEVVLFHELLEMVMVHLYCRFEGAEGSQEYLFHFTHTDFCRINEDFYQILKDNKLL